MIRLGKPVTLAGFCSGMRGGVPLEIPASVQDRLARDRAVVDRAAAGEAPVYGLNTGLGGNLAHRLDPEEIAAFQRQILEGRAIAVGPLLPEEAGRGILLARLVSTSGGGSGISPRMFAHLAALYASGLSPALPRLGSIGAADLTQNAVWALAVLGSGQIWRDGVLVDAGEALAGAGLAVPDMRPKDAMALINHGGLSVALAASALCEASRALAMARAAVLLSYAGYDASRDVLAADVNALRPSPGQQEMAAWLAGRLEGGDHSQRRVQEALSFRVVAPVMGAAQAAWDAARGVWEQEANGLSDSPAVIGSDAMRSTANFHAPALSLALESCGLALAMAANGAVQRCQRMMTPGLSGLPKYLSSVGGASAGMVPMQKTAAAVLAEIRRHAMPVALDPAPVSETVEDMAAMTPLAALKLSELVENLMLLCGIEAVVAAQAVDLRGVTLSPAAGRVHAAIRDVVAPLAQDRAIGVDIPKAVKALAEVAEVV